MKLLKRLIAKIKHNRVCMANGYNCAECMYRDFIFEGAIFRGNKCREPNWKKY